MSKNHNYYYVQYCNNGTEIANNAYVEITLESPLWIESANIPFTGPDANNTYSFDIGNVGIGQCGQFRANVQLPCDTMNN